MTSSLIRLSRLALLAAAAPLLSAAPPRLGVTAGAAWPTGGTRGAYTDTAGFTVGAFADWEQRPGHALRVALDGTFHPKSATRLEPGGDEGTHGQSHSLVLDYIFRPRAEFQGFYLVLGAGAVGVTRRDGGTLLESGLKLGWNAGFGIDLNERWGLLARYQAITWEGRNLGTVTAGLTYRF